MTCKCDAAMMQLFDGDEATGRWQWSNDVLATGRWQWSNDVLTVKSCFIVSSLAFYFYFLNLSRDCNIFFSAHALFAGNWCQMWIFIRHNNGYTAVLNRSFIPEKSISLSLSLFLIVSLNCFKMLSIYFCLDINKKNSLMNAVKWYRGE